MAIHSLGSSELRDRRTANAYRAELEREDLRRRAAAEMREIEQGAKLAVHAGSGLVEREIRSAIRDEQVANEIRNASMGVGVVTSVVGGVALLVASCASDASYNREALRAQNQAEDNYQKDLDRRLSDVDSQHSQTLSEYSQRVSETRDNLDRTREGYYAEYKQVETEASKAIQSASDAHQKESQSLAKEERRSDQAYKNDVQNANSTYQAEVQRINSELSGAEQSKALSDAASKRDAQIAQAESRHSSEIQDIHSRATAADNKYNDILSEQNSKIDAAKDKYASEVKLAKNEQTNAENRLSQYRSTSGEKMELARDDAYREANRHNVHVPSATTAGRGAQEFVKRVDARHLSIGEDLAARFGTASEQDLMKRVMADRKAEDQANKTGDLYTPTTSDSERAAAQQLAQKYAGDIKTEKGLTETLDRLKTAEKTIKKELNDLKSECNAKQVKVQSIDKEIAKLQQSVKQISADQKALATGKDANGNRLTDAQKQIIKARLQSSGDVAQKNQQIADLTAKKNKLNKEIQSLGKKIDANSKALAELKSHVGYLDKNGKALLLARNKKGLTDRRTAGLQAMGIKMIMNSTKSISREFKREIHKGNDFHKEVMGLARGAMQVAQKYEFALGVMTVTTRILMKPAGMMVKVAGKSIMHTLRVSGATRLTKILGGTGRFVGGVGKFAGGLTGAALRAPIAVLKAPMKILNAPQNVAKFAAKKTLQAGMFVTRKTTKFAVGTAAKAAKMGIRVVGAGAKWVGKRTVGRATRFIGKKIANNKWYKRAASRMNLLRKRAASMAKKLAAKLRLLRKAKMFIMKIISSIISALSSILSSLMSALAYVFGALLIILIIIIVATAAASIFTSILAAIAEWWEKQTAEADSYVKNDPLYIANMAVNYRNSELDIYDLFLKANKGQVKIKVNNAPVYYELYDTKWYFLGLGKPEEGFVKTNDKAYNTIQNIFSSYADETTSSDGNKWKGKIQNTYYIDGHMALGQWVDHTINWELDRKTERSGLRERVSTYRETKLYYYAAANPSVKSEYEISNAKDAMAIVDTLYTQDPDMQKHEVLAYLGVGKYQLGKKSGDDVTTANNLFWNTHEFVYESGNKASDIWYHTTSTKSITYSTTDEDDIDETVQEYQCGCNNYKTLIFRCDVYKWVQKNILGVEVWHWEKQSKPQKIRVQVCSGHIDLKVGLKVTSIQDGDAFFNKVKKVDGLPNGKSFFSIYTNDDVFNVSGWGGIDWKAYNPESDWSSNDNRELAKIKSQNEIDYNSTNGKSIAEMALTLTHYKDLKFASVAECNGKLVYVMCVGNAKYYVPAFKSGYQKDVKLHNGSTISFGVTDGIPDPDE